MEGGDTEERRKKVLGIECLFCTFFGESDIIHLGKYQIQSKQKEQISEKFIMRRKEGML